MKFTLFFLQSKVTCRMPPKKGRRRRKVEDSDGDEAEVKVPTRRGVSTRRDENYVWDEDHEDEPPSKKGRGKKKSVVWNDNDCRADVCLRPPGTSRYLWCSFLLMRRFLGGFVATPVVGGSMCLVFSCQRIRWPCLTLRRSTTVHTASRTRSR